MKILIGLSLVAVTIIIHAIGTSSWVNYLINLTRETGFKPFKNWKFFLLIAGTACILMLLHFIEVALWAITYMLLPAITELSTFDESMYFSLVTFSSLGYGDITLGPAWRLLSGIEALNGIVLIGWSTALIFTVVERSIQLQLKK